MGRSSKVMSEKYPDALIGKGSARPLKIAAPPLGFVWAAEDRLDRVSQTLVVLVGSTQSELFMYFDFNLNYKDTRPRVIMLLPVSLNSLLPLICIQDLPVFSLFSGVNSRACQHQKRIKNLNLNSLSLSSTVIMFHRDLHYLEPS